MLQQSNCWGPVIHQPRMWASRLLPNYQTTEVMLMPEQSRPLSEAVAGCSERPSSKAVASEGPRRTLGVR